MNCRRYRTTVTAIGIACLAVTANAQEITPRQATETSGTLVPGEGTAGGTRRALLVCGLAGDAPHRELFAETLDKLYGGLTRHHGFAAESVVVLWSDEVSESNNPAVAASRGPATKEAIAQAAAELTVATQLDDALWVFVLGHSHYDGRYSWLNIPGDDIHQLDFAKLFAGVRCREQVFFLTQSSSGFYLKPLSLPGRVVVTATEPDLEVNETLFPHKLAEALADERPFAELDLDRDGRLSLLDIYLWTARETAQEYAAGELLATEHAQLDDNGDGRGSEVQADFLPEELGGRLRIGRQSPQIKAGDGALARQVFVPWPPSPPAPHPLAE
jgi:hypothetical protein